jgi:hypothetical protein
VCLLRKLKSFVDGFFLFCKMVEIHQQKKPSVTSLIFILNFQKKKEKTYDDFKD